MSGTRSWLALAVAVAAVIVLAVLATSRQAGSEDGAVGRYQIVSGCYDAKGHAGPAEAPEAGTLARGVFKIDTATGATWVYREEVLYKGMVIEKTEMRWEPIQ
jgi:hypothetical protein